MIIILLLLGVYQVFHIHRSTYCKEGSLSAKVLQRHVYSLKKYHLECSEVHLAKHHNVDMMLAWQQVTHITRCSHIDKCVRDARRENGNKGCFLQDRNTM